MDNFYQRVVSAYHDIHKQAISLGWYAEIDDANHQVIVIDENDQVLTCSTNDSLGFLHGVRKGIEMAGA